MTWRVPGGAALRGRVGVTVAPRHGRRMSRRLGLRGVGVYPGAQTTAGFPSPGRGGPGPNSGWVNGRSVA